MYKVIIPSISFEEMKDRYEQIRPVIRRGNKLCYFKEFTLEQLTQTSFIWDCEEKLGEEVPEGELTPIPNADFECLTSFRTPDCFRPTIGEILAQIDPCYLPIVKAFEIMDGPKAIDKIFKNNFANVAFENGYHVSLVRLYK